MNANHIGRIWLICAVVVINAGCFSIAGELSRDEVARITSPGGNVDAVLVETNGGATTSFGYEVFLVPEGGVYDSGVKSASIYGAVRNEQAYGVNLRWYDAETLYVEFLEAKSEPIVQSPVTVDNREINIRLRSGIIDEKAPPGGMLYNRPR